MNAARPSRKFGEQANSMVKKIIIWTCILYIFYLFRAPQSDYISSQVSEVVVYWLVYVLTAIFILVGLYMTMVLLFGNHTDIENICRFVLENYIAIMLSILIVNR